MPVSPKKYDDLTPQERANLRGLYYRAQGGNCWYCKMSLWREPIKDRDINTALFPPNFFNSPVHLHHDHATGMTVGTVHAYCNAVSFQYDELPILKEKTSGKSIQYTLDKPIT